MRYVGKKLGSLCLVALVVLCVGSAVRASSLAGFDHSPFWDEQTTSYTTENGVRVHINAPAAEKFDRGKPTQLIFFALPNGNNTDQTIGKAMTPGLDWHYNIQHIGAQTRRLRELIPEENIVVAYLEADKKSWPSWRQARPNNGELIRELVTSVTQKLADYNPKVELSAHSGGGSLIFGFINGGAEIPDSVNRIAFLDADYAYDDEKDKHGDKLLAWLKRSPEHCLCVVCYDDRNITVNGKLVVGPTGGTYRATTERMMGRLEKDVKLTSETKGELTHVRGMNGQIDILIHHNSANAILHTVLVEKNGFIRAATVGSKFEGRADEFWGDAAYRKWIQGQ